MAEPSIVLNLRDCVLSIEPASAELRAQRDEWSLVQLETLNGETYHLGSDDKPRVIEKLIEGLTREVIKPAGFINGIPYIWIFSLTAGHTTLYVAEVAKNRYFYFEDSHGKLIHQAVLNLTTIDELLVQLKKLKVTYEAKSA